MSSPDSKAEERFEYVDLADLLAEPYRAPEFLVEHLIPRASVCIWTGESGCCKTTFALHTAVSLSVGLPVAGKFSTFPIPSRPTLYLNSEMNNEEIRRFGHAVVAGAGLDSLPSHSIEFQGPQGLSDFYLSSDVEGTAKARFVALLQKMRPQLIFFDTFRGAFGADESKASEVRAVFSWLRALTQHFDTAIVVLHHLRKPSMSGNGARERVSGSTDLTAAPDVHVALRSPSGKPLTSLLIDKTRAPFDGVRAGTQWPIEACWIDDADDSRPRSTFSAGDQSSGNDTARDQAKDEILATLEAGGPKTRRDLGVKTGGTRRRALEELQAAGEVVTVGMVGRAYVLGLPGQTVGE